MNFFGLRLERRVYASRSWQVASVLIALGIALVVSSFLVLSAGANLGDAWAAFISGSVGTPYNLSETFVQATPLIFTGLAVLVAFRGRLWNIGAEGQFFAGAMAAYWASSTFSGFPPLLMYLAMMITAIIAGAIWGGIPGLLKARFRANEVIVTVMMNYIISYFLSYLLGGPWQDPNSHYLQTALIPDAAHLPILAPGTRLHAGFAFGLLLALLLYLLLWRTTFGYEIRAFGSNPEASRYKGVNYGRTVILVMALSGAIAALGGAGSVAGLNFRLRPDISSGYGFTGIIVAVLGQLHPAGALLAAFIMGVIVNGSLAMQITTGVPVALAYAIQGIVLVALLTVEVISRYRIRRVVHA